jgi:SAM-dependent methyltransferase
MVHSASVVEGNWFEMATETPFESMPSGDKVWFQERTKRVRRLIASIYGEIRTGRILDVAMGKWSMVKVLFPDLYVVGIDYHVPTNPPNEFRLFNVRKPLPFSSSEFSMVFAGEIIEHVGFQSARHLLREISRVLRPDGYLLLTTPNGFRNRLKDILGRTRVAYHEREFSVSEMKKLLADAGFRIVHMEGIQPVFVPWKTTVKLASLDIPGFLSSQVIYVCRKVG